MLVKNKLTPEVFLKFINKEKIDGKPISIACNTLIERHMFLLAVSKYGIEWASTNSIFDKSRYYIVYDETYEAKTQIFSNLTMYSGISTASLNYFKNEIGDSRMLYAFDYSVVKQLLD